MNELRVVTLAGDPEQEAVVAARLAARTDTEVTFRCVDRVELLATIRAGDIDAIVSVGAPTWLDGQSVEEAGLAGIRLVGVAGDPLEGQRLSALGATVAPDNASSDEIVECCRATDHEPPPVRVSAQPSAPRGKLIAVWGPKGAPGRSTIAIELAAELAAAEPETLLIDGDLYGGDITQMLGIVEELPTIVWAARLAADDELEAGRLALDLRRAGRPGPVVLPGLPRAELWAEVSDYGWRRLLTVARASFRFTICDVGFCLEAEASPYPGVGEGRNRAARAAVRDADQVVAVCSGDPIGIKSFLWAYSELRELAGADNIVIVANRVRMSEASAIGDLLRKHVGQRPVAYIADSRTELARALMAGASLKELKIGADFTSGVRTLAAALGGRVQTAGLLTKLAGRA